MPRKLPDHVERNRVKGHLYFYFRRDKGPRIRLPHDVNSLDFQDAYAAALAGSVAAPNGTARHDLGLGHILQGNAQIRDAEAVHQGRLCAPARHSETETRASVPRWAHAGPHREGHP